MATIKPNDLAPQEEVRYLLANAVLVLGPKDNEETTDSDLIAAATAHPWLTVEVDSKVDVNPPAYVPKTAPEDDVLLARNSVANNPDAVAAAQESTPDAEPTAIDAGLDQSKVIENDAGVNQTLAADAEDNTDNAPKTRKKGS